MYKLMDMYSDLSECNIYIDCLFKNIHMFSFGFIKDI